MIKIEDHIISKTDGYIAVNKPAGLLSIPGRAGKEISLKQILQEKYNTIYTVHRLDKDTSGLIVFAFTEEWHKHLSRQFELRTTKKIYLGLVLGKPAVETVVIEEPIMEHPVKKGVMTVSRKGKESITEFQLLESFRFYSWASFKILTGRTHQIRVHMKHMGHPIACDEVYGDGKPVFLSQFKSKFYLSTKDEEEKPLLQRLALHSAELQFADLSGGKVDLEAPLPKDLKASLNQLRKYSAHKK